MNKGTAIKILGQAAIGNLTINQEFKDACEMGKAALAKDSGYVKLPSEEELAKILSTNILLSGDDINIIDFMFPEQIRKLAKELLKLLKETG